MGYALLLHWSILVYGTMIATQKRLEGEETIAGSCLSGRLSMRDLSLWGKARKEISISGVHERESLI